MTSQAGFIAALIKLTEQTAGRDKLCRVIQYGSRFVYWAMEQRGMSVEMVKRLKRLEGQISTARKLFRIGKSIDHLKKASRTIHLADPVLRLAITLSQINRGFYLLFDHIIWAGRVGLITVDLDYWKKLSSKFWLVALLLGLVRDAYELLLAYQVERKRQRETGHSREEPSSRITFLTTLQHNPSVVLDAVKNGADFFIPPYNIGLINLPSGIIGLLGTISSIVGLYTIWNDSTKLKYA